MSYPYQRFQRVAEAAARAAGELLRGAFGRSTAREKGPADLVTEADLASQRIISRMLSEAFPEHTLLAEEEGVTPSEGNPWRWIVDPLDGTLNFAHGNPLWCVSIALEHAGELVLGVIYHPLLDVLHSASAGAGLTVNGQPSRASLVSDLSTTLSVTGMPINLGFEPDRQLAYLRRLSIGTHSVRRTGTSAWNLAQVASGGFDACYATSMYPWDAAAGVVLVREAGGLVTDLEGRPFDLYTSSVLATNGRIHAEMVAALAEAWPPPERVPHPKELTE